MSLEWLAGYFDGEGCITLTADNRHGKAPCLRVKVCTADRECIDAFVAQFGGNVHTRKVPPLGRLASRRRMFDWSQSGSKAQDVLRQLLPFLRSDKKQLAELVLQCSFKVTGVRLSEEEYNLRQVIRQQVSAVNQRVTIQ